MNKITTIILITVLSLSGLFAQEMRTDLRDATYGSAVEGFGVLPATDPYLGTITVKDSLPEGMVDWVLVELHEKTGLALAYSFVGCLMSDGSIKDTTGINDLEMVGVDLNKEYYVAVKHRNHLGVVSDSTVTFVSNTDEIEHDFTGGAAYENIIGQVEVDGNYAMISGDGDGNDYIQTNDRSGVWVEEVGKYGYLSSDYDLNAFSQTNDRSGIWVHNVGKASQILFKQ